MARILGNNSGTTPGKRSSGLGIVVQGVRFVNSAAKFWPSLIDELLADYPACDAIEFAMLTDLVLERDLLFPANALQRELDRRQERKNFREAIREAMTQFDMLGPPGIVHARLLTGSRVITTLDLPLDCVDADIFPCLLVWLLEWSEIPPSIWNTPQVSGDCCARDREREINYRMHFDLHNEHLSEGLFRRALTLRYAQHG